MRILAIVPARKKTGASLYSNKLYQRLPAEMVPGEDAFVRLLSMLLKSDADLYHIQFEYRGFGSFPRSLILLTLLTLVLSLRRPVVITLHGLIVSKSVEQRRFGWLSYFMFFASVRLAGVFAVVFVVHSELMKTVLKRIYRIENVVVIPCGTDADELGSQSAGKHNKLIFFGFIRPSKGIENLIEALAIARGVFPNLVLTVAGSVARPDEAEYLRYLRRRVQQHNLDNNVNFKEARFGDVTERTRLVGEAITVVLPYTDNFVEISGVVHDLAEYGVPIVCSHSPRFSELVDEFDCLKVSPTPADLADAIVRILKNPELRSRLGANLRLKAQKQSWNNVAQQHFSLYQKLVGHGLAGDLDNKHS